MILYAVVNIHTKKIDYYQNKHSIYEKMVNALKRQEALGNDWEVIVYEPTSTI